MYTCVIFESLPYFIQSIPWSSILPPRIYYENKNSYLLAASLEASKKYINTNRFVGITKNNHAMFLVLFSP